ncbi:two-component system response regulator [Roseateles aquatilis]|uniref:Two-component system response regulator n=1 Tax=Roseateles aquatilis TaxID=431061 RepID=A0A246JID5_9BURK|nr:response regulator transcription factor [Roseateles aquatilis]OWQ92290.1 two-component system response regulator [Roseateles aquatilis]
MQILLIEDDAEMSRVLARTLEKQGYSVTACLDGVSALRHIGDEANDIVLLDLNLPQLDGLHILQRMRMRGITTPVIILTARGAVGDKIAGLNSGADDYLAKPFDLEELDARIRALLRRHGKGGISVDPTCGQLRYHRDSDAFLHGQDHLELSPREHALLRVLAVKPGQAVKKEKILKAVFPNDDDVHKEAVEVLVYRLRKRLVATGAEIITLRGLGYMLRAVRGPAPP